MIDPLPDLSVGSQHIPRTVFSSCQPKDKTPAPPPPPRPQIHNPGTLSRKKIQRISLSSGSGPDKVM